MAQNYIRQSSFTDGDTITAGLFNNEYNQLVNAFAYSSIDVNATGHTHDGSLGQGGNISKIGDLDFLNKIEIDGTNNRMGFFVEVGGVTTEQVRISDGLIVPVTTNDIDLGSASLQFKDAYFDGTVNIDSLVADTADVNGGTVDNVTIGGTTPAVATFTTANATTVDTTNIEVTNIKAKDGTAAGSIADSTGVVTLASSVLTTADINGGTLDAVTIGATTAAEITGTTITYGSLSDGVITITAFVDEDDMVSDSATLVPTQQSVKAYVDAQVTAQDLDFQGDTGGALSIDLDSETLTIAGGTGIDTVGATNTLTVSIDSTVATLTGTQTLTNKTIDADNNTVSNLEVDNLKTGVLDTDLASVSASHDTIPSAKAVYDYVAVLAGSSNPAFTGTVTADNVTINGNTTLGSDAADTVTINADVASDLIPSVDGTYDLGASGAEWQDLFIDGTANIDSLVADTADINAGTIDGTVIGGSSAAAITGTTITGTSFVSSGDMTFGDDDKAIFGAGSDLQIYHDGSNSYVKDSGNGDLIIQAYDDIKFQQSTDNADLVTINTGGNVTIHSGNLDVTGTVTADGLITNTAGTSNFIAGVNAGNSIVSGGNQNTVIGDEAGTAITTGDDNVAVGFTALDALDTGQYNVALGTGALSADTKGNRSVAVGLFALNEQNFTSSTDAYNVGVGFYAGRKVTTGTNNTLIGGLAGDAITTADNNTAVGQAALTANTTAANNTAVGYAALTANTTGTQNVAVGSQSLLAHTTGNYNVAVGQNALVSNTTASDNTSVGAFSLDANTTGANNTAVGKEALGSNTTADNNTAVGNLALFANTTGHSNVAVGTNALDANTTANDNTAVGFNSLTANTTGTKNTGLGAYTNTSVVTGSSNTAVGYGVLDLNTGSNNTGVGSSALLANTTGTGNTAVGEGGGSLMTTGSANTILGRYNGNQGGLDIRTSSNNIVLSDGDGNPRLHINSAGTLITSHNIREQIYNLTGTDINPVNGSVQYKTLAATTTFTESLADGDSVILRLAGGDTYAVTWPTMTWVTSAGNTAPTLGGSDVVVLWQESSTVYGAYVGSYA
jgi:hypothetical protein